ncbi:MAG: hypothetical protein ABW321_04105, partial [Polyangiales bacterium]
MQSSRGRWGGGRAFALSLGLITVGCGSPAPHATPGAATEADAGVKLTPVGHTPPPIAAASDAGSPVSISTALAQLTAVGPDSQLTGTARWWTTSESVDLEMRLQGCPGKSTLALELHEPGDCSAAGLQAPVWESGGADLPVATCFGGGVVTAQLAYTRRSGWSIGQDAATELVGRQLVARDSDTRTPLACGVITRGPDMPHVSLPPDDQPPGREARAALAAVCFARQFPNTGP